MNESTTQTTNPLDAKILEHLGDRVILKPLTRWNEAYKEFPRYVMEYLVSRYVEADNPVAGQHKIDKILTEHYAESAKIANTRFDDAEASISILKDYMQTGKFSRGDQEFSAPTSISTSDAGDGPGE
jgi:predicted ATP-dependent Lon-type protease